jgi:hypothetical protein
VLKLCRAEACQSVNGERLAKQFLDRFGVEWGGTTPDGRLTIEATYCLGLCASGPSAMLDGEVIGRLDQGPRSTTSRARSGDGHAHLRSPRCRGPRRWRRQGRGGDR